MEVAGRAGISQVLVPGCLDFITTGRLDAARGKFPGQQLFVHNPELTLVRMSKDQMCRLAEIFARKANGAKGPTTVCVPTRGLSTTGSENGPFWNPEADGAFVDVLNAELTPKVKLVTVDDHINSRSFVDVVLQELSQTMSVGQFAREKGNVR
jgi:uncharacterized protein (UPF0261 family)